MLGTYYYHEIIRKTIVSFGTLFNQLYIKHKDADGDTYSEIRVPISYGPSQKFLARIEQQANLNKPVQITLPRMSFEMNSIQYDSSRKSGVTQTFKASDGNNLKKVYLPVPYNIGFELNILSKLNDDSLQIIEQILPYFQPAFTLTVDLVDSIGEKRDIPVILDSISFQDDYEGDFSTRRALIYTLQFTAKTYLFGPVADVSKDIIEKVSVGYISGDRTSTPSREVTYSVDPRAIQSYTNNIVTNLSKDITNIQTIIEVNDASSIATGSYITIDNEELRIASKSGNRLTVERGADSTSAVSHVAGSEIKLITAADNALIQIGDDFGFDGTL